MSGLPGTDSYSLVYVADGERVYRIGLWTRERGLDDRARTLLASLRLEQPTRSVQSLDLEPGWPLGRARARASTTAAG